MHELRLEVVSVKLLRDQVKSEILGQLFKVSELGLLCPDLLILYVDLASHLLLRRLLLLVEQLDESVVLTLESLRLLPEQLELLLLEVELLVLLHAWNYCRASADYRS